MARPSKPHLTTRGHWRTRIDGQEVYLGRDRAKAHRKFHALMAERGVTAPEPETVAGLIARWVDEHPADEWDARPFREFTRGLHIEDIPQDLLGRYHQALRRMTYQPPKPAPPKKPKPRRRYSTRTIQKRIKLAVAILRTAASIDMPAIPSIERPQRRAKDVRRDAIGATLAALPQRAAPVLQFMVSTSARPGEACNLRWSDVDLATGTVVLNAHKTAHSSGQPRTIYLTEPAREILLGMPHRSGAVFLSRLGKPYTVAGLRSICRRRGFLPGQMRHTFAQLGSEELPEQDLAKLMGHASTETTRWYYDVRDARARKAASSLTESLRSVLPPLPGRSSASAAAARPRRGARKRKTRECG